jgi:leucyl-tRNA synthetase
VEGVHRFLGRVYRFVRRHAAAANESKRRDGARPVSGEAGSTKIRQVQRKLHQTIKRITDDFQGRWHFNTCVAAIMEFVNELYGAEDEIAAGKFPAAVLSDVQRNLVLLLEPFAPYLAHELWEVLGEKDNLLRQPWPVFDPALAKEDEVEYVVQVNGKIRARLSVPADSTEDFVRERALADEKVKAALEGKQMMKLIVVPGKLVNIVVK